MKADENVQLVLSVYQDFGKRDIPAILDKLADDVRWVQPEGDVLPWGGTKRGRAEVAEFFDILNAMIDYQELNAAEVFARDDRVIVLGNSMAVVTDTSHLVSQEWVMAWTVNHHGKIAHVQYYDDTAKWVAGLHP